MKRSTDKIQQQRRPASLHLRWITIVVFVMLSLLIVEAVSPVFSATSAASNGEMFNADSIPTLKKSPLYSPATPLPSTKTPTPTLPSTSTPAATLIPPTILISRSNTPLYEGPGSQYPEVQTLDLGTPVDVLGRTKDNVWLYVRTGAGKVGWIKAAFGNTTEIKLNNQPVKTPTPPPNADVKVSASMVHLRRGPGTNFSTIRRLEYGETLKLMGKLDDNTWLYLKTEQGEEGWLSSKWINLMGLNLDIDYVPIHTPPPTETSTPVILEGIEGRWIDIDLSEQRLRAYEGTKLVGNFLVSTGTVKYPTEQGTFKVYRKLRYEDMEGSGYFLPDVPFTMYYSGAFAIHGTYWHHNFGTRMSRGCVNMETSEAEWLYNWAEEGTIVHVHR